VDRGGQQDDHASDDPDATVSEVGAPRHLLHAPLHEGTKLEPQGREEGDQGPRVLWSHHLENKDVTAQNLI